MIRVATSSVRTAICVLATTLASAAQEREREKEIESLVLSLLPDVVDSAEVIDTSPKIDLARHELFVRSIVCIVCR